MNRSFTNQQIAQGLRRMRSRRSAQPQPKSGMNKFESQFAAYLSHCQEVVSWKYEPMSFWLAENLRYTPDFMVEYRNGELHAIDVKALWSSGKPGIEDDSLVKLKAFAQEYGGWFIVKVGWFQKQTRTWEYRVFQPQERSGEGAHDVHPKA